MTVDRSPARGSTRAGWLASAVLLCALAPAAAQADAPTAAKAPAKAATSAKSRYFDGYQPKFSLGQAGNGAVCEATRNFDGPVVDRGGRVWTVTCRGWSSNLGSLYIFAGGRAAAAEAAWRATLAARTDCNVDAAASGKAACKTKAAGLGYVVYRSAGGGRVIVAEGRAPIDDVLGKGAKYLAGAIPEPATVDLAAAAVSQVSTAPVSQLSATDGAAPPSVQSLRAAAYSTGQNWQFDQAELDFADLAQNTGQGSAESLQAEALYNQAFNASNAGRFDQASVYFDQADKLAVNADSTLMGLALNYKAADARNQEDYDRAIELADQAIALRAKGGVSNGMLTPSGAVMIPEVGVSDGTEAVSRTYRERLRDVQALEIKATALEASGSLPEARKVLLQARDLLTTQIPVSQSTRRPILLGKAAPWLNTRILADLLRIDRGTPAQAQTEPMFRAAVSYFGSRHPGSLPLAGFFLEQARAEADLGKESKVEEDKAVADYKAAFDIFIDQRGSLADSADLAKPYFDFLLRRIGTAPATHQDDVKSFFNAAQALIAQSSAEAAKRQAATAQAGDDKTAALARALQDTDRRQKADEAALRKLTAQGVYQGPEVARLRAEQVDLANQNAKLQGQLLEADPSYTSALHTLVDLDQLEKSLKPGEIYAKVFLLAGGGYGVIISPEGATPYAIKLTRDGASDVVRKLRVPIDFPKRAKSGKLSHGTFNVALAHELFEDLFGPVQGPVLAAKHIIYEPDATLIALPISALVTDDASAELIKARLAGSSGVDYGGVAWLGAHSYNSIALSASAFYQARNAKPSKASSPFFGFGDPVIPSNPDVFWTVHPKGESRAQADDACVDYRNSLALMPPLPETRPELLSVAKALLGASYSDEVLRFGDTFTDTAVEQKKDLNNYRVLYFATHGLLDEGNPCLRTALVTSFGGGDSDALLDLAKITSLRLDADMVVLSACNTGSNAHGRALLPQNGAGAAKGGKAVTLIRLGAGDGEALGGLVTSFVEAGARNVVVSNWEVDSATTQTLMIGLFKQKGLSQAEALAIAERTLMNEKGKHSHPYYWAPFTVVGDGARMMPGPPSDALGATRQAEISKAPPGR